MREELRIQNTEGKTQAKKMEGRTEKATETCPHIMFIQLRIKSGQTVYSLISNVILSIVFYHWILPQHLTRCIFRDLLVKC